MVLGCMVVHIHCSINYIAMKMGILTYIWHNGIIQLKVVYVYASILCLIRYFTSMITHMFRKLTLYFLIKEYNEVNIFKSSMQ